MFRILRSETAGRMRCLLVTTSTLCCTVLLQGCGEPGDPETTGEHESSLRTVESAPDEFNDEKGRRWIKVGPVTFDDSDTREDATAENAPFDDDSDLDILTMSLEQATEALRPRRLQGGFESRFPRRMPETGRLRFRNS